MSCLGSNYNPTPTRDWTRYENNCFNNNQTITNNFSISELNSPGISNGLKLQLAVYKKGNILQYKKNSAGLTKNQRYAQIATGNWTNTSKTWAVQSVQTTNPNTNLLKRVNYNIIYIQNYSVDGTEVVEPVNCPIINDVSNNSLPPTDMSNNPNPAPVIPPPPPPLPPNNNPVIPLNPNNNPTVLKPIAIKDGGTLICNISENPCTGQILNTTQTKNCYSTNDSNVPGTNTYLCWNDGLQTYYPKTKLTYGAGGNKWPTNSKFIFPAAK